MKAVRILLTILLLCIPLLVGDDLPRKKYTITTRFKNEE